MKRPGPSFVVGTSNARRGPADNAFFHFGQIRMNRPGPSFVVGTSNARRGPADNVFFCFGQIRMKCPGPSFVAEHPMPEEALQTKLFAILVKSG
jgi:hypothetical protein